jgi:hypothetical protein
MEKLIFFDESSGNHIKLIGCFSISDDVYRNEIIQKNYFDNKIAQSSFSTTINELWYNQESTHLHIIDELVKVNEKRIKKQNYFDWLVDVFNNVGHLINVSVINFNDLSNQHPSYNYLRYNKLPERLIYGMIKHSNHLNETRYKIFLDSNDMYTKYDVENYMKNHLNALSIYRRLKFNIDSVAIIDKRNLIPEKYVEKQIVNALKETNVLNKIAKRVMDEDYQDDIMRSIQDDVKHAKSMLNHYKMEKYRLSKYSMGISIIDFVLSIVRTVLIYNHLGSQYEKYSLIMKERMKFIDSFLTACRNQHFMDQLKLFDCRGGETMQIVDFKEQLNVYKKLRGLYEI